MNLLINKKTIAVSILDVENVESFLKELSRIRDENQLDNIIIHFDIMDGQFVPSEGVNLNFTKLALRYGFFVDFHLMVKNPLKWIKEVASLGADNITIHYESEDFDESIKLLNEVKFFSYKKVSIGISINPDTKVENLKNYLDFCDDVLVMSVKPGYGGQSYMNEVEEKISYLKSIGKVVQIDGGINANSIISPNKLGVQSFVIGSYFTKNINDLEKNILYIENIIKGR